MSKFSEMLDIVEPIVLLRAEQLNIQGTEKYLEILLETSIEAHAAAKGDPDLVLANAVMSAAILKRWIEAFEAECDRAEAEAGAGLH